jgi:signal transduction histidine kinase
VGLLAISIGGLLSLSMTRPLRRLQSQIQTVADGGEAPGEPAAEGRNEIAAIAGAFHELVHKAALLQQMEVRSKHLMALSSRTAQAQEEERERIARELHDSLGQALTAIKLDLSSADQALGGSCPAGSDHLSRARSVADQSLDELRRLVFDLRPPALDNLGLVAALESYCRDLGERSGLAVAIDADAVQSRLPAHVETALYRICQEALTNVWRHASATSALVRLTWTPDAVTLAVSDDGSGFDTAAAIPMNGTLRGVGLLSMERRAEDLGGAFRLESKLGEGTRVSVTIPWRAQRRS